ncbi:MAG: hypothetical protein XD50_1728 [Clostridia bacterium 41_269]|nr:MAG: hypothetical protein XD50_1728 [Clostridia bacterium 41_269]
MRKEGKNRRRFILASNTSAGLCLKSEGEVRGYSRAISVEKIRSKITECLEKNNLEGMVGIATVKLELREAALKKSVSVNSILLAEKAKPDSKGEKLEINKDSENLSKIYHLSYLWLNPKPDL